MEPTSVYLYYDKLGVLLYVGITKRGSRRQAEHNELAEWWKHVAKQEIEHYDSRPEAAARETMLIRGRRPPFNQQQNPDYAKLRAAYLTLFGPLPLPNHAEQRCGLPDGLSTADNSPCPYCESPECLYWAATINGHEMGRREGYDDGEGAGFDRGIEIYHDDSTSMHVLRWAVDQANVRTYRENFEPFVGVESVRRLDARIGAVGLSQALSELAPDAGEAA